MDDFQAEARSSSRAQGGRSTKVRSMRAEELHLDPSRLAELCEAYDVARLELFGSFVRGDVR